MWCDNCCLLFPLRGGAIALAVFIALYNLAGGIFLFRDGPLLFFTYPEPQVYGGIAMASMAVAVILVIGLSNQNFLFTRLVFVLYPFILFVLAVRAGLMLFRLNSAQDMINWECQNGGALYNITLANSTVEAIQAGEIAAGTTLSLPTGMCSFGFHSLYLAFAFSLAFDIALQIYLYFCSWRYMARLRQYYKFSQAGDGVYTAP